MLVLVFALGLQGSGRVFMLFLLCFSTLINIQFDFIILYINPLHRCIALMFWMHSFIFSHFWNLLKHIKCISHMGRPYKLELKTTCSTLYYVKDSATMPIVSLKFYIVSVTCHWWKDCSSTIAWSSDLKIKLFWALADCIWLATVSYLQNFCAYFLLDFLGWYHVVSDKECWVGGKIVSFMLWGESKLIKPFYLLIYFLYFN